MMRCLYCFLLFFHVKCNSRERHSDTPIRIELCCCGCTKTNKCRPCFIHSKTAATRPPPIERILLSNSVYSQSMERRKVVVTNETFYSHGSSPSLTLQTFNQSVFGPEVIPSAWSLLPLAPLVLNINNGYSRL